MSPSAGRERDRRRGVRAGLAADRGVARVGGADGEVGGVVVGVDAALVDASREVELLSWSVGPLPSQALALRP
jgi:hypothetical protein